MTDQLERQTDALAALLVAGDYRAAEIRARRHAGPGMRGASLGRAVLRRRPRAHDVTAGEASDLIAAGR